MEKKMRKAIVLIALILLSAGSTARAQDSKSPPSIITFKSAVELITLEEAEAGTVTSRLSWVTDGMTEDYALDLQLYRLGRWESRLPQDMPPLPARGAYDVVIEHPLNFGPPMARLVIVAATDGRIVDERVLVIPFDVDDDAEPPQIETLRVSGAPDALSRGATVLPVTWAVSHRAPGTNLVFEQLMPGAMAVSAELPRPNRWIPSSGEGLVAVSPLPGGGEVLLRLRVIDVVAGVTLDELTVTLGAPAVATPTPTFAAPPQATVFPVTVSYFTGSAAQLVVGQPFTLRWSVDHAVSVRLVQRNWAGAPVNEQFAVNLPAVGEYTYTVPAPQIYNELTTTVAFELVPRDRNGFEVPDAAPWVRVGMACPFAFFFGDVPDSCPETAQPVTYLAAQQNFENGRLVWLNEPVPSIYALYRDGTWQRFVDEWAEGAPIPDLGESPPAGRVAPQRGFGFLWTTNEAARSALGWGLELEVGYMADTQFVAQASTAKQARDFYLTLADGSVLFLDSQHYANLTGVWTAIR
jgi:hypothetical protein